MQQLRLEVPVKSPLYAVDIEQEDVQNLENGSGSPQEDNEWLPCNFGEYRQLKLLEDKLSIPCIVRQPHKSSYKGLIVCDRGSEFDIEVDNHLITLPKAYIHPDFPEKCQTDDDISPSKKSRRKKGTGSGYINWRDIKKNGKNYKQTWFHYELWDKGRQVKSCVYIPKGKRSQIEKLNTEKVPVEEILKILRNKKK